MTCWAVDSVLNGDLAKDVLIFYFIYGVVDKVLSSKFPIVKEILLLEVSLISVISRLLLLSLTRFCSLYFSSARK